ncbi:hypothetical protein BDD12DRAFT_390778 [Trichophaea hybrida]|nr:hypothetical protein BDD12DRAFT_390778 [Trichophaea hybrida]
MPAPIPTVDLKAKIKEKAVESVSADIAVDKNSQKNINIQEGENAVGPAGKGGVSTLVAHTVIESGTTKVQMSQQTGAALANARFFPGGVMPMGNVDMVFPDIVINNANDINNANENQNQVAAANENANLNPNNAANQNANQNFNEFTEVKEFKEFKEQQFAENHFNFEEKNFYLLNGAGATATIVHEVPVAITHTVQHTEVIAGETQVVAVPVTETVIQQVPETVVQQVQLPAETVIECVQLPGQTVVEQIYEYHTVELPGQTIVEQVQLPGQTVVEYHTVELPGQTIVEQVQLPEQTVVEYHTVQLPPKTIVEQVQLPGQTVVEQIYEYRTVELPGQTIVEQVQLPGQTVVEYHTVQLPPRLLSSRSNSPGRLSWSRFTSTALSNFPDRRSWNRFSFPDRLL